MSLTERFAVAIRFYRELSGLSQEELSARCHLDRTYISQLERGLKSPTLTSIGKIAEVLAIEPSFLLREPRGLLGPRFPQDYHVRSVKRIALARTSSKVEVDVSLLLSAVSTAHKSIDDLYASHLDIAAVLGMRNLSAFVGELVAAAIARNSDGLFKPNPHQDGYPDLLLMDRVGLAAWEVLSERMGDKAPFSPFAGGGIEIKATCGSVPTPANARGSASERPSMGMTRIGSMKGYDWKAHHRDSNNMIGLLWDFLDGRPRIVAMFYSSKLRSSDWGNIVSPRAGGGRTTSVSIMTQEGIRKMYDGWLCVAAKGGYCEFLNKRNNAHAMPASRS